MTVLSARYRHERDHRLRGEPKSIRQLWPELDKRTHDITKDHQDEQEGLLSRPRLADANHVEPGNRHRGETHEQRVQVIRHETSRAR